MTAPQSKTDKLFMRVKDGLMIAGVLGSFFVWGVQYYGLPGEVAAQAQEIKSVKLEIIELKSYTIRTDGKLARIEDKQEYTNKGLDRIEGWLKSMSNRRVSQ